MIKKNRLVKRIGTLGILMVCMTMTFAQSVKKAFITREEYLDKVTAAWYAQIIAVNMGLQFEHRQAAVKWVNDYPANVTADFAKRGGTPLDDDWYYEMAALNGFKKYGPTMTVQQLGKQWVENRVGTWGSSEMARLNLEKGIEAPASGHPRYNRLWFTMGNQCRGDLFGLLAPGLPNEAARLSSDLGHVNSYAEGTDGGVMLSTMISLAFTHKDHKDIIRKASKVLHPSTAQRQVVDMVISLAEAGKNARDVFEAVEDKWHLMYPATNNAPSNLGLAITSLWFGEGNFMKTLNLAFSAGDFTDADCNAALAGSVIAVINGTKALPAHLTKPINNRIFGEYLGPLKIAPAVDITISQLAANTVEIGEQILKNKGVKFEKNGFNVPASTIQTRPGETFNINNIVQYWNPEWQLKHAGVGAPGGGFRGIRGGTFLDGNILSTFPYDEVRGTYLTRSIKLGNNPSLNFEVAADPGRAWKLEIFVDNDRLISKVINGGAPLKWEDIPDTHFPPPTEEYDASSKARKWQPINVDLKKYADKEVIIRLYDYSMVRNAYPGNAYWRNLKVN